MLLHAYNYPLAIILRCIVCIYIFNIDNILNKYGICVQKFIK